MSDYGLIRVSLFIPNTPTFYTNFLRLTLLVHLNLRIENQINEQVKFIIVLSLRLGCYLVLINYGIYFTPPKAPGGQVKTVPSNIGDLLTRRAEK